MLPPHLIACRAAVTFLTRIPIGGFPYPERTWAWVAAWFPTIGFALGGIYFSLYWILSLWLPPITAILLVTGFGFIITGGLHEDGLADTADALGGGYDQNSILKILKDSRMGTFGILALILAVHLKVQLLNHLDSQIIWGFILGQSLSRGAALCLLFGLPYIFSPSAKDTARQSKSAHLANFGIKQFIFSLATIAFILSISIFCGFNPGTAVAIIALLTLTNLVLGWYFCFRAGGLTGDFLGCSQQISEICILLILVMFL